MSETVVLDSVDWAILRHLSNDARMPNKQLAQAAGVAPSTALERVARLRRAGVVTGFTITVDHRRLGRSVAALLSVKVRPHRRDLIDPFLHHVTAMAETQAVFHVTGPADFIVHVTTPDVATLQRLVLDQYTARTEVVSVQTTLIFDTWPGPGLPTPTSG